MIVALRLMDPARCTPPRRAARAPGQLRAALALRARARPSCWIPLAMMALVGTLSFNFQVLLPLLADFTWHGTATTYALLTAAMGVGSVVGALAAGARGRVVAAAARRPPRPRSASPSCSPPIAPDAAAADRSRWCRSARRRVTFAAGVNSTLQLAVEPAMRGRVMALYSVVFLGSTPIGAPLVGWLAEVAGPRAGLALGAAAALVAAIGGAVAFARAAGEPVAMRERGGRMLVEALRR